MFGICFREFYNLFKSIRSIIFILIMFSTTLIVANFLKDFDGNLKELGLDNAYVGGLLFLILLFGPLFVTTLSHDLINRESYNRTIRFLVTKISRDKIILGKFLGVLLFWFVCLFLSLFMLVFIANQFYFKELIESLIFMSYFISLSLFLSVVITKPSITIFTSILISIAFPIIGIWGSLSSDNLIVKLLNYFTPYYYFSQPEQKYLVYFVPVLSLVFFIGSILIFRKRDL
ncbi:ABC transporter permease [Bacillus cereus]|uniref:ABC transporter permease n=1 Tax=Bacillus cereus TaxID=1396 RepID=UPI0018F2BAC5|nr:ABC transporter permease subunit [Bacillus cereus]MBJ8055859.1 ABC transporter permease [Bacillus cereus]